MDERLISLETRIAYQDKTIDELNNIVIILRNTVERLQKKVTHLESMITDLQADQDKDITDDVPPHY